MESINHDLDELYEKIIDYAKGYRNDLYDLPNYVASDEKLKKKLWNKVEYHEKEIQRILQLDYIAS